MTPVRAWAKTAPGFVFALPGTVMAKDSRRTLAVETFAVRSSLETACRSSDLSCFATADLAIAAADSAVTAAVDSADSADSADSFGFAGSFRSAGIGLLLLRLRFFPF